MGLVLEHRDVSVAIRASTADVVAVDAVNEGGISGRCAGLVDPGGSDRHGNLRGRQPAGGRDA